MPAASHVQGDWIESTGIDLYESDQALMLARNSLKEQDEVFQEFSNDFHRLRRQLLIGTHDEVLNILSRYFQASHDFDPSACSAIVARACGGILQWPARCAELQDFVDDLVSERINPAKPPMSWPCDEVLSELWEVVNGPKLAPGQSAPSLQLDYMGQQQRMALLDALRSNGPVPSHRSSFPITLHMKVALKRYRQGCKERKSQRLAVHGRFARAVRQALPELLQAYQITCCSP